MIEFKSNFTHNVDANSPLTIQRYNDLLKNVFGVIENSVNSKIILGDLLRELWESKSYAFRWKDASKFDSTSYEGRNSVNGVFFFVCESEFGLDRSEVSRLVNVAHEFSYLGKLSERWKDFKYSALCEILSLKPAERSPVKSDWTIRQIREYKKQLKLQKIYSQDPEIESESAQDSNAINFECLRDIPLPS